MRLKKGRGPRARKHKAIRPAPEFAKSLKPGETWLGPQTPLGKYMEDNMRICNTSVWERKRVTIADAIVFVLGSECAMTIAELREHIMSVELGGVMYKSMTKYSWGKFATAPVVKPAKTYSNYFTTTSSSVTTRDSSFFGKAKRTWRDPRTERAFVRKVGSKLMLTALGMSRYKLMLDAGFPPWNPQARDEQGISPADEQEDN